MISSKGVILGNGSKGLHDTVLLDGLNTWIGPQGLQIIVAYISRKCTHSLPLVGDIRRTRHGTRERLDAVSGARGSLFLFKGNNISSGESILCLGDSQKRGGCRQGRKGAKSENDEMGAEHCRGAGDGRLATTGKGVNTGGLKAKRDLPGGWRKPCKGPALTFILKLRTGSP